MNLLDQVIANIKNHLDSTEYSSKNLHNDFFININNHWCFIEVQRSVSSTKDYLKFTMNFGINIPFEKSISKLNNVRKISKLKFQLNDRIGFFLPIAKDYWWLITDEYSMKSVCDEILSIINDTIIPLFIKYTDQENILQLCKDDSSNRWFIDKYNKYRFIVLFYKHQKSNNFNKALQKLLDYSVELDLVEETKTFLQENGIHNGL